MLGQIDGCSTDAYVPHIMRAVPITVLTFCILYFSLCFRYYNFTMWHSSSVLNKLSPRGQRDDMPPAMAVRLAADLRPCADGSAVRTWLSCRQPACLYPRAAARLGQLRRGTHRRTDGRIAVSLGHYSVQCSKRCKISLNYYYELHVYQRFYYKNVQIFFKR